MSTLHEAAKTLQMKVKLVTVKVKKGCGQRKNKRDAAGRAKHREVVRQMKEKAASHKQ